jgi:hypothetical protein
MVGPKPSSGMMAAGSAAGQGPRRRKGGNVMLRS